MAREPAMPLLNSLPRIDLGSFITGKVQLG